MKKAIRELLKALETKGRLHEMAVVCTNSNIIPSAEQLFETLKAAGQETHKRIDEVWELELTLKFKASLITAVTWYGGTKAVSLAASTNTSRTSEIILMCGMAETFQIGTSEDVMNIGIILESAPIEVVKKFRRKAVSWGELELSDLVAGFLNRPLTKKEMDRIVNYNLNLPDTEMALRAAKRNGRYLSEAELAHAIARNIEDGSWHKAHLATLHLGRQFNANELAMMSKVLGGWRTPSEK
jgi:hypothetical protein